MNFRELFLKLRDSPSGPSVEFAPGSQLGSDKLQKPYVYATGGEEEEEQGVQERDRENREGPMFVLALGQSHQITDRHHLTNPR